MQTGAGPANNHKANNDKGSQAAPSARLYVCECVCGCVGTCEEQVQRHSEMETAKRIIALKGNENYDNFVLSHSRSGNSAASI